MRLRYGVGRIAAVVVEALASRGRGVLLAAVAGATVVVLGVEVLSLACGIAFWPMSALVVAAGIVTAGVYRSETRRLAPTLREPIGLAGIAVWVIGAITLLIALVAAPNTWDSMTYHLPRVAHWAANGTVAHYPTSIDRQLWQPPFGEYFVLVGWVLLLGLDLLANLPAWLASAGCVLVAIEIGRLLGLAPKTRMLTALVVATLPPLILESTSTQTDPAAAFWIAVTAYLALSERVAPSASWHNAAWIGAALGLAVGTKGTALPLALPWVLVGLQPALRIGWAHAARGAAIIAVAVVGLNGAHWSRNLLVFNGPLGPSTVQALLRPSGLDPATVAGNVLANASLHWGTPWATVNEAIGGAVRTAHASVGLDVAILYPFFGGYRVDPWNTHENVAGAPLHVVLCVVGLVVALVSWRRRTALERTHLVGLLASVMLLGATVRWQPYNARLHLPLLVVGAPGIALAVRKLGPGGPVMAACLLATALPALAGNATRPLWTAGGALAMPGVQSVLTAPRHEQYFASRMDALPVFERLENTLAGLGCGTLRLHTGYDGWEYPLLPLLHMSPLEHVFVENASTEIGEAPLPLDACVIVLDERPDWRPSGAPPSLRPAWAEGRAAIWAPH